MRALVGFVVLVLLAGGCDAESAIEVMFHRHGPEVVEQAKAVAWCESRFDPAARNGPNLGLFQMNERFHSHRPGMDQPFDALHNAQAAEDLYAEQGWTPWSCG